MGWRRGYAPDCKAPHNPCEINQLPENRYQDKPETSGEHDNSDNSALSPEEKENPGALAGATGTNNKAFWAWFDHNTARTIAATRLAHAVADCDPADRVLFLETILNKLCPDWSRAFMAHAMTEARWLMAELAPSQRKAMTLAGYESLSDAEKRSFVNHITGARHV